MHLRRAVGISVALNLLLLAWFIWSGRKLDSSNDRSSAAQAPGVRSLMPDVRRARYRRSRAAVGTPWSRIESTNLWDYAANLRRVGCPEESVCDILRPASGRATRLRTERLRGAGDFWAVGERRRKLNRAVDVDASAARKEEEQLLASLACRFGEFQGQLDEVIHELTVGFAGPEVRDQVGEIVAEANRRIQRWRERSHGFFLPEDLEAIRRERDALQTQLAAVLPPALLEEFELRVYCVREFGTDLVMGGGGPLAALQLNPTEFRELVRTTAPSDLSQVGPLADYQELLADPTQNAPSPDRSAELKSLLGEARYEEYLRGREGVYLEAKKLTGEFGQSPDVARAVQDVIAQLQSEIPALYARATEDRETGRAALRERREAYLQRLEELLAAVPADRRRSAAEQWTDRMIHEQWHRP